MTREENIRAILDTCFSESKDEIKEVALKNIMSLSAEPKMTVNVEYDVEYLPDKDGVHQAKATITNAEPSGDLISRQWLLDLYDIDTTDFKEIAKVPLEVVKQNIKDAPSVSIQPKTIANDCDLISREDAIEVADKIVEELSSSSIYWHDLKCWAKELFDALPSAEPKGANLINRHDATTVIREECLKCNNLTNADLLGRILALPTSRQTDCTEFIMWLIEVVLDDEDWELNAVAYGETIARKLKKLGLLEVKDGYYIRPSAEKTIANNCDLISRADAIEAVVCHIWHTPAETRKMFNCENYVRDVVEEALKSLPSANRPKGEWVKYKRCDPVGDEIYAIMEAPDGKFFCNRCGKYAIKSDYCPNCGADMRGEDDG